MQPTELTRDQRAEMLTMMSKVVAERFYDPTMRGVDWAGAVANHRDAIVDAPTEETFERAVTGLLAELNSSHVGFFRQRPTRASAKAAISATYSAFSFQGEDRWVFQDVHEGGPAAGADIRPGDVLMSVDGRTFLPPEHPVFPMATTVAVDVMTTGSHRATRTLGIPAPVRKRFQLPYVQPTLVTQRRLGAEIGYLRIAMFPGVVGVEVANEISAAVQQLNPVERLIVDLRGNPGGGVGVVRLMSLLTEKRLPIGYSIHRCQLGISAATHRLPVFEKIPTDTRTLYYLALKLGWPFAALQLGIRVKPLLLRTEALGAQPFHGRVVLLMNRHTASASEMAVAFARENSLAVLVGEATPGRLLSGNAFKLPYGYKIALPVGAYHTARDWVLEGSPIVPDVEVPFDPALAREGRDAQLERAIDVVSGL